MLEMHLGICMSPSLLMIPFTNPTIGKGVTGAAPSSPFLCMHAARCLYFQEGSAGSVEQAGPAPMEHVGRGKLASLKNLEKKAFTEVNAFYNLHPVCH